MQKLYLHIRELFKSHFPIILYALIALSVLGPLLKPGYILSLDSTQIFSDSPLNRFYGLQQINLVTAASLFFDFANKLVSAIAPGWFFEKLLIFFVLFLAGIGAHRLVNQKGIGAYFAGVLYMLNPFMYIRIMAGQWGFLWAYALIPFALKAFLDFLDKPDAKNIIKLTLLTTIVGMLDIHGYFIIALIYFIFAAAKFITERYDRSKLFNILKGLAVTLFLFLLFNLYWIIPALSNPTSILSKIGLNDQLFFAPHSTSGLGVVVDLASLWGFWRGGYIFTGNLIPIWWIFSILIVALSIYGLLFNNKPNWLKHAFIATAMVSFLLALGVSTSFSKVIFDWLWQHIYFFRGFRDSQQFLVFACLFYAYFGGVGLSKLGQQLNNNYKLTIHQWILAVLAFSLVILFALPIFWFHGQLTSTDYPPDWYAVKQQLDLDKTDFNVLFLPWHEYMVYQWINNSDKMLSVPAHAFFDEPVIAGDNMENGGIYSEATNPISQYVDYFMQNGKELDNLGELLAPLNIKYIILVDEADYQDYSYLYKQQDLKVVMSKPGITLLENLHTTTRSYAVNSVEYVQTIGDYVKLSQTQDVMEHIYVLGDGENTDDTGQIEPVNTKETSPIRYSTGQTILPYTIFTVPQEVSPDQWRYNGQSPVLINLGMMPVFNSSSDGGEIVYSKFYQIYLPCYVISFASIGFTILLYWKFFLIPKVKRKKHV